MVIWQYKKSTSWENFALKKSNTTKKNCWLHLELNPLHSLYSLRHQMQSWLKGTDAFKSFCSNSLRWSKMLRDAFPAPRFGRKLPPKQIFGVKYLCIRNMNYIVLNGPCGSCRPTWWGLCRPSRWRPLNTLPQISIFEHYLTLRIVKIHSAPFQTKEEKNIPKIAGLSP